VKRAGKSSGRGESFPVIKETGEDVQYPSQVRAGSVSHRREENSRGVLYSVVEYQGMYWGQTGKKFTRDSVIESKKESEE